MTVEIIVPTLGESVVEATVAKWFKGKGDTVARDEVLVELETDKVNLEVTAEASGTLEEVVAGEGEDVEVGAVLGRIAEGAVAPAPAVNGTATVAPAPTPAVTAPASEITLSPAVRHLVAEIGVDPSTINGTGKGGRILKGDVIGAVKAPAVNGNAAAPAPQAPPEPSAARAPAPASPDEAPLSETRERRVPMSRLRRRVAERLKEAQNTAAMLTTFNEVDMTELMALRVRYKDSFEKRYGVRLGFMSFFVKAAIVALKEQEAVNAEIDGTDFIYKDYYNIGVAVGAPQGLVVPVLKDADRMSFAEVEKAIVGAAVKARDGKLTIADMSGGTFTITNGGVYGSMLSTPILNTPQSAVLGMHNIVKRPVAVGDAVEVRPIMYLALSYDHRIIDGREAVTFLVRLKQCIEDPSRIMLDI